MSSRTSPYLELCGSDKNENVGFMSIPKSLSQNNPKIILVNCAHLHSYHYCSKYINSKKWLPPTPIVQLFTPTFTITKMKKSKILGTTQSRSWPPSSWILLPGKSSNGPRQSPIQIWTGGASGKWQWHIDNWRNKRTIAGAALRKVEPISMAPGLVAPDWLTPHTPLCHLDECSVSKTMARQIWTWSRWAVQVTCSQVEILQ